MLLVYLEGFAVSWWNIRREVYRKFVLNKKLRDFIFMISKIYGCNMEGCDLDEFQITDDARDGVYPMSVCTLRTGCNAV